jgi:hypothetical protein
MLVAPTVIGASVVQLGFPAIFIGLAGLLLTVAALAPAVAPAGEGARGVTAAGGEA